MIQTPLAVLKNPWLRWFWEHGGEEIIGPHGPFALLGAGPQPEPWRTAVEQLVQAVQAKDLASRLPKGQLQSAMGRRADGAISMILDDWCGTPPRKYPWPWPGPPPWVGEMVAELSRTANTFAAGSLRDGILDVAAKAIEKANTGG